MDMFEGRYESLFRKGSRMKWYGPVIAIVCLLLASSVSAKHALVKPVPPVVHNGIRYEAPNYPGRKVKIEAWDETTEALLWDKVIYTAKKKLFWEDDLSWDFIVTMRLDGEQLSIVSEHGKKFTFDLKTKKVRCVPEKVNVSRPEKRASKHSSKEDGLFAPDETPKDFSANSAVREQNPPMESDSDSSQRADQK